MASKTKSGLSETPKATPATPRVSKLSRGVTDSASPVQSSRLSIDRSPRSITSKPVAERRASKITTPPEKLHTTRPGVVKGSELQAQLTLVQEDLKKAKEQIAIIEKEKAVALDELRQAQKLAEEVNEKLQEALVAQKRAEENSEIEKFRAVELEQTGIEAFQKKEEEWQKELEDIRNQHALDVAALLSTTQELQKVKHELTMTTDAKNQALSHADDATKIAEIHADKVDILSAELTRVKALLDSKLDTQASKLNEEIDILKKELERAKAFEDLFVEREAAIEQLNVELEAARMAESYARSLAEEWKSKVEEANKLERSASESLCSVMKQLEGNNDLLHDAETEISGLKEKIGLLEMTIARQKGDLEESERSLGATKNEFSEMAKKIESLKLELEVLKEEKAQALNNEKLAASSVVTLLEEKNKLITELENSREEEEKSKKAMESLASALHEVSAEAREAKEKILSNQVECQSYETQIEDLRLVLKEANERYEIMLDDSKHELDVLKSSVEESKVEWEKRERSLVNHVRKSEEENLSLEREIDRLVNLLKKTEEESCVTREEEAHLKDSLKEVEAEVISLQENLGEAKIESVKLKESLLDKENELQNLVNENEDLRIKESESRKKIEELSKLLEEALANNEKQVEENGELLSDSEKDYDLLPKVVEFSEENGEKTKTEFSENFGKEKTKEENGYSDETVVKTEDVDGKPKEEKEDDSVEVEFRMWESCKIEKEYSPEREAPEQDSGEDEADSKVEEVNGGLSSSTENVDNSGDLPSKEEQQQQKKKKPLLRKFGNLLKKKSTSSNSQK